MSLWDDLGDTFGLSRPSYENENRVDVDEAVQGQHFRSDALSSLGGEMKRYGREQNRTAPQLDQRQLGQYFGAGATAENAQRSLGNQQQTHLNTMQAAANGQGASAAELAMRRASADAAQQQLMQAAAAGGGPGGVAAAIRAQNANAQGQGQLQRDLGVQRAEEQMAARQAYADALNQTRGQDLTAASMYGQLGMTGAQANQTAQLQTMGMDDAMRQFYYGSAMQGEMAELDASVAYGQARPDYLVGLESADASRYAAREQAQGQRFGSSIGLIGAAAGALAMSDVRAKTDIRPAGAALDDAFRGMSDTEVEQKAAPLSGGQKAGSVLASALGSFGANMTGSRNYAADILADGEARREAARREMEARRVTSDVRAKTDIAPADRRLSAAFRELPAYSYEYREPDRYGYGEQTGLMAQDLERNPVTRSAVETGPDGMKRIDGGKLATMTAAEVANMRRELDDVQRRTTEAIRDPRSAEADQLAQSNARDEALLRALNRAGERQTRAVSTPTTSYPTPARIGY